MFWLSSAPSAPLRTVLRGLAALAVAMGIGRFAFTPQLPVMQAQGMLSLAAGGWLASANYLGYFVGALWASRGGVSAAALMRWGLWAVIASTAAMAMPGPLAWWAALRFAAGIASACVLVGTTTIVLAHLRELDHAHDDGFVFAGVGIGIALAGLLCHAGMLADLRAATLWLALAALALAGAGIVRACAPSEIKNNASAHSQIKSTDANARGARRLVLCYGLFGFGYILPATYLPSQARLLLGNPALFGWVWPLFGMAAAFSTLNMGIEKYGSRKHRWACAQGVMAVGVLLPAVLPGLTGLALAALCVGGTFMLVTMLGLQQAREQAGACVKKWLAAMTAAFAFGQLLGPVIANGLLGAGWTFNAVLGLGACALLVSSALLVFPCPVKNKEHP